MMNYNFTIKNSVFENHTLANTRKPFFIEEYFFKNTGFKTLSDSFKESFVAHLYANEYSFFLNSFKNLHPVNLNLNLWWVESWFYTYNSIIALTFVLTIIFLIGLFLPKTSKGVSFLNVLGALSILLFLFFLPIPHYKEIKSLIWFDYNLFVYIYILISGFFTASFLALNNEVTFLKENKHLEYPLLILLIFLSGIAVIASENFIAVFLALEAITLISAVLIGFQRTNNLSTLAGIRYIFFSAVPGGALILGLSEIYAYTGAFNFSDIEKLLMNSPATSINNYEFLGQSLYTSLLNVLDYSWDMKFQYYISFLMKDHIKGDPTNSVLIDIITQIEKNATLTQLINNTFINMKDKPPFDLMLANLGSILYKDSAEQDLNIKRSIYVTYKFIDEFNYQFLTTEFLISWTPKIKNYENIFNLIGDLSTLESKYYRSSSVKTLNNFIYKDISINSTNNIIVSSQEPSLEFKRQFIHNVILEDYNYLFKLGKKLMSSSSNIKEFNSNYNSLLTKSPLMSISNEKISIEYLNLFGEDENLFQKAIGTLKFLTNYYHDVVCHYEININMTFDLEKFLSNQDKDFLCIDTIPLLIKNHSIEIPMVINMSVFLIIFYILFKLTAAPFHIWAPAIYEGAPLPISMFLSIFSKITMIFLLIKLLIFYFYFLYAEWSFLLILSGMLSIFVGLYGAISETRIKRFFVYSSMGHVGFMLLGIAEGSIHGITATLLYLIIYTITVFIGWSLLLSSRLKITHINQLSGLSKTNPTLSFILAISMLSMSGIPPLAGFYVKFEVLYALVESEFYSISLFALLLTVFSFFYYLRIIKILYFEPIKSYTLQFKLNKTQTSLLTICFLILINFSLYFQQPIIYLIKNIIIQVLY